MSWTPPNRAHAPHRLLGPRGHRGLDQRGRGVPLREEALGQPGDPEDGRGRGGDRPGDAACLRWRHARARGHRGARAPQAILIAQESRELFAIVNDGFGRTRPVCYAADVAGVLRTIEDQEVAVLLCDFDGFEGADVMLKMLKQAHPQIQTVAIAASPDSNGLISLINEAQILRFMTRPLRLGLLDRALRSALAVHANYKDRPVLLQRQLVRSPPGVADSSIGRQILQRLGMLMKPREGLRRVAGHGAGSA